ncbi:hypothetical protein [Thauera sp.]|uniref:hypothetical protein n=1 Tax=Thauera sp. TaxID=1905334 RepID=UPI0039E2F1D3
MTNEIVKVQPKGMLSPYELNNLSTQELRAELALSLTMSARHLAYLASVWGELEKRGEDLSDLRTGMAVYLPQIASGRLDAEAVVRFAGMPTVLRSLAGLPIEEQQALAKGRPVTVLTVDSHGQYTTEDLPAYTLTASQARLAFDGDKIRSPTEQKAVLENARVRKIARARPGSAASRVRYDSSADVIRIGRASATVGEVAAAIAEAAIPSDGDNVDLDAAVVVKLTETEHRMVKARAAEAGQTAQAFLRSVVKAALIV